jgi:hypothetical protein
MVLAQAGVEGDLDVHGPAVGGEVAHQERGGEQAAGDLGHHGVGEGEASLVGHPGRLDRGGVPAVVASHDRGGSSRRDAERPRGRPADQSPEDGFGVEAGRAQPVDGTVAGDQGGGAGVAEKAVVLDRCRRPPSQRLVGAHRRHLSRP